MPRVRVEYFSNLLTQLGKDLIVLVKIGRLVPSAASRAGSNFVKVAENVFEGIVF